MSVLRCLFRFSSFLPPSIAPFHSVTQLPRLKPSLSTIHISAKSCSPRDHAFRHTYHHRHLSDSSPSDSTLQQHSHLDHTQEEEEDLVIPAPPTTCCMSGCSNCVWITYAQELVEIYKDGGKAAEKVMKAIDDPSLKIFLNLELKELLREKEH